MSSFVSIPHSLFNQQSGFQHNTEIVPHGHQNLLLADPFSSYFQLNMEAGLPGPRTLISIKILTPSILVNLSIFWPIY